MKPRNKIQPLPFVLPALFVYILTVIIPILWSMGYSLFSWNGIGDMKFIGLENYVRMFQDETFREAVVNNLKFVVLGSLFQLCAGLILAILLTHISKGGNILRVIYFIPCIISSMAIFGSYIGKDHALLGESVNIALLDTFVAITSGLIIFPACFTFNVDQTSVTGSAFLAAVFLVVLAAVVLAVVLVVVFLATAVFRVVVFLAAVFLAGSSDFTAVVFSSSDFTSAAFSSTGFAAAGFTSAVFSAAFVSTEAFASSVFGVSALTAFSSDAVTTDFAGVSLTEAVFTVVLVAAFFVLAMFIASLQGIC